MTQHFKPAFRLTVTREFYEAVAQICGSDFADSYLFGATMTGQKLTPRTLTGHGLMRDSHDFMELLKGLGVTLVKPKTFQTSGNAHTASDPY